MTLRTLAFALAIVPAAAHGQMDWIKPQVDAIQFGVILDSNNAAARRARPAAPRAALPQAANPATANASFAFASTPASRKAALDALIQRTSAANPDAGSQIAAAFRQHDPFAIYERVTAPAGVRPNDAADVFAAYIALGYIIATGAPDPTPAQFGAIRRQFAGSMAGNPRLATPTGRAALGEEMKLQFMLLHTGLKSAVEGKTLPQFRPQVAAMFAQQGLNFGELRLTDTGLARR
jgi:hypothetical protein